MNRLWVRFSLLYFLVILLVVSFPVTFAILTDDTNVLDEISNFARLGDTESIIQLVEEQQRSFVRAILVVLSIGGMIGVVVGILVSRSIASPLENLRNATGRIKVRDYSVRVPVEGSDEIMAVSQSFNEMTAQLENAETLRQNLLSDVAHELRNPLHVIKGNVEAMIDGVFPMSAEELGRILGHTQLLTTLVDDLRELAQAEANQLDLNLQKIEMARLVDDTVRGFKPTAAEKDIRLDLELLGKLPTLELDAPRIRQVLLNLLSNAVRYTPEGGYIRVSAEQIGEKVEILIKDSGVGIEPENLPMIFDRFYRTDKARTREKGGTGLGLAIVKALTEAHGGQVSVDSPGLNQGSEFRIVLPAG
ncbi:MAG: HAMP domain-containing sensor histidine kinase [Chloroflexota bacterium]